MRTLALADSKTGEPRVLPLTPALVAIIARRWEARQLSAPDGTVTLCPVVRPSSTAPGRPAGQFHALFEIPVPGVLGRLGDL